MLSVPIRESPRFWPEDISTVENGLRRKTSFGRCSLRFKNYILSAQEVCANTLCVALVDESVSPQKCPPKSLQARQNARKPHQRQRYQNRYRNRPNVVQDRGLSRRRSKFCCRVSAKPSSEPKTANLTVSKARAAIALRTAVMRKLDKPANRCDRNICRPRFTTAQSVNPGDPAVRTSSNDGRPDLLKREGARIISGLLLRAQPKNFRLDHQFKGCPRIWGEPMFP